MYFLKTGGYYMLYVQGNCIESTNRGDGVFSYPCQRQQVQFKRMERVTLEPFDRDHAYVSGIFRTLETAEIDPRDDGRPIGLYEKQKKLPLYILFELSRGYVLFRAHDVYKVERTYVDTEKYIESFDKNFELVACHAFASSNEALMYLTADGNGDTLHIDILRGVRMNIDKFFKNVKPGDLEKAQVDLARIYSRQRLDSPDKGKLPKKRPLASVPTRRNPQRKARAVTKTK
ncbi:snoRNP complex protein nop56, variant 2 [Trifolium repens]|nr:snoRNP complex protein nop56, variant 2 [Trifolium repens]